MSTDRERRARRVCLSRPGLLAVALSVGVAALAGCGSNAADQPTSATASTSSTASATPEPASSTHVSEPNSPAAEPTADGDNGSAGKNDAEAEPTATALAAAPFPKDAGGYGEALIAAWRSGKSGAMSRMATGAAVSSLQGAKAPSGLLLTNCEGDMCSWSNEAGDRVTLTFDEAKVSAGQTRAVIAATVAKS